MLIESAHRTRVDSDCNSDTLACATLACDTFSLSKLTHPLQLAIDLLNPTAESEARKHKLKRLVQSPNSFFMVGIVCTSLPDLFSICHACELPNRYSVWF